MKRARLIDATDIFNTVLFAILTPFSWVVPERHWTTVAHACARAHLAMRASAAGRLAGHPALAAHDLSPQSLERTVMAGIYEELLQTLREYRPGGWRGAIRLLGRHHVDRALESRRGAILWVASCNFAELNVKKAFHAAGHPITNLRSNIHPYSATVYGRAVLNRVRTTIEDRFLRTTVTLRPDNGPAALRELQASLRANSIVSITANSAGEWPCRIPFMGGSLNLALGAATLARISKAPLLPVFTSPAHNGIYDVEINEPLQTAEELGGRKQDEQLAALFAARLEAFVNRYPTVWRGWFNRHQWEAEGRDKESTAEPSHNSSR